jgi:replication factor C subunit 3/5
MLEATKVDQYPFIEEQKVRTPDWQRFVDDLGRIICEEQSPQRLLLARSKMYELLVNCIPADVVIKSLTEVLLRRVDDQIRHQVTRWAAFYEHRMQTGAKPIFHLEGFVAKFMSIYKRWVLESFG